MLKESIDCEDSGRFVDDDETSKKKTRAAFAVVVVAPASSSELEGLEAIIFFIKLKYNIEKILTVTRKT
jgi:hypothetical protein